MVNEAQPRLPRDMPGLLAWATSAADGTAPSQAQPLDDERRQFLRNVFQDLTVNEVEVMRKDLEKLASSYEADTPQRTLQDKQTAIDELQMLVENLDNASDLIKLGGYDTITALLEETEPSIRAGGADILATILQSHPFCQEHALKKGTLNALMPLLSDPNGQVRKKAMYAISAMVREYEPAEKAFLQTGGMEVIKVAFGDENPQVRLKAMFLLRTLCTNQPTCKDLVREHDLLETITALVTESNASVREQAVATLLLLVEDNPGNLAACQREETGLQKNLTAIIKASEGSDDTGEEAQLAKDLYKVCFA